jgi:hypothetical protein
LQSHVGKRFPRKVQPAAIERCRHSYNLKSLCAINLIRQRPGGAARSPPGQAHGLKIDAVGTGEESQFVRPIAIPRSAFGVVVW